MLLYNYDTQPQYPYTLDSDGCLLLTNRISGVVGQARRTGRMDVVAPSARLVKVSLMAIGQEWRRVVAPLRDSCSASAALRCKVPVIAGESPVVELQRLLTHSHTAPLYWFRDCDMLLLYTGLGRVIVLHNVYALTGVVGQAHRTRRMGVVAPSASLVKCR